MSFAYFGHFVVLTMGLTLEHVLLSDVTQEPLRSRLIAFDAIKWVPR